MALKSEDCMLNNWVLKDGKYKQLKMCGFMDLHSFPSHFEGIPLSESVLLKCTELEYDTLEERFLFNGKNGAEYILEQQDDWYYIGITLNGDTLFFVWDIYCLHTLQNVMSAIGKHLTFKP